MARVWLFLSGLSGAAAVMLGAYGAHGLALEESAMRTYSIAQHYHALHSAALALFGLTSLVLEGREKSWASGLVNAAAAALCLGIIGFSGSLYAQSLRGSAPVAALVPIGGLCFIAGWLLFAIAALGLKKAR
jgi:uncharacterized membrane protein YgdD (TMEM256/DUF423 family)